MDAARLENLAADFTSQSPLNHVCIELSGEELTLFDRPLLGYACAGDPLFEAFLAPGVIGPHYRPPQAWLETAQTVVSFFLPFSQAVRAQNRAAQSLPSQAWLYGRVEGQRFVEALSLRLLQALQEAGFEAVAPSLAGFLDGVRAGGAGWTRLYQQLVRAARRVCVRPGHLRPLEGTHHAARHGRPLRQPGHQLANPSHPARV